MQVIEITELDKRRSRVRLEDGRSFTLYKGECRQLGLREGEECAEGLLEEIYGKILKTRARKRALHLLERMDHTEAQLRRKLGQETGAGRLPGRDRRGCGGVRLSLPLSGR